MKKFAFLLAAVAVFAMSASAFATPGDIDSLLTNGAVSNQINGAISNDKSLVVSGDYATKAYYVGEKVTGKIALGIKLSTAGEAGKAIKAQQNGAVDYIDITGTEASKTEYTGGTMLFEIDANIRKAINYKIGYGDPSPSFSFSAATKSLDVIPTKVGFDSTITVKPLKGSVGSADISADFAEKNPGIVLHGLGEFSLDEYFISYDVAGAAKSLPNDGKAAVIGGLSIAYDADSFTLTVSNDQATPAKGDTKVELEIVAAADNLFNIIEGDIRITVAGVQDAVTAPVVVGKITIDVEESEIDKIADAIAAKSQDLKPGLNVVSFINGQPGDADANVVINSNDPIEVVSTDTFIFSVVSADADHNIDGYTIADGAMPKIVLGNGLTHDEDELSADLPAATKYEGGEEGRIVSFTVSGQNIQKAIDDLYGIARAAAVDREVHMDFKGFPAAIRPIAITFASDEPDPEPDPSHSSGGGACSTGLGLTAAAGLAALALRKRGK